MCYLFEVLKALENESNVSRHNVAAIKEIHKPQGVHVRKCMCVCNLDELSL